MNNPYDRIEEYLNNELNEKEKFNFEAILNNDSELQVQVNQHRKLIENLHEIRLRKKVNNAIGDFNSHPRKSNLIYYNIAASIIIVIGISIMWYFLGTSKSEQTIASIPNENLDTIQNITNSEISKPKDPVQRQVQVPIVKVPQVGNKLIHIAEKYLIPYLTQNVRDIPLDTNQVKTDLITLAENEFFKGNYHLALTKLHNIQEPTTQDRVHYINGYCYFNLKQFEAACFEFKSLWQSDEYRYEAQWNQMLCNLAMNKRRSVDQILNEIISNTEHPFYKKAKELNKMINE